MNERRKRLSLLLAGSLGMTAAIGALAAPGRAAIQQDPSTLVDRVIAIVGDTAVLQSDLQEFVFRLTRIQGVQIPEDPSQLDAFLRQALEQKVNEVLLVIHAEREGITVTEAELNEIVDDRLAQVRRQFPNPLEFEQALAREGTTLPEYRIRLSEQAKAEVLANRYLQMKMSGLQPVPVSEEEIQQLFEVQKQAFGSKPATVTLKQVVIAPKPSEDALLLAQETAERALSRARSGEDFARLAREFSDDPGTRDRGGDLGWVRRGELVADFENSLFSMGAGDVSGIIETPFGFHIIKLDRIRGNERSARHILVIPEMTDQDTARAHQLADEVAAALDGGADVDSLIARHGDPTERSSLTNFAQDRLPAVYQQALQGAQPGDVLSPFLLSVPGIAAKWIVAKLLAIDAGGEWTLDDARETIRTQIQQERMLQRVVGDLRNSTYIEIRFEGLAATR